MRRDDVEEAEVDPAGALRVDLAKSAWTPVVLAARGAVDQTFRQDLYRMPFGRRFYEGFIAKSFD